MDHRHAQASGCLSAGTELIAVVLITDVAFLFQVMEELLQEESLTFDSSTEINCTQPCEGMSYVVSFYVIFVLALGQH